MENDRTIRSEDLTLSGDVPGLLEGWYGPVLADYSGDPEGDTGVVTFAEPESGGIAYLHYLGRPYCWPEEMRAPVLDLTRPECRDRLIRWAAEGVRCAECAGQGRFDEPRVAWATLHEDEKCHHCNVTGYTRPPHDLSALRDSPGGLSPLESAGLLWCSVRRILAGLGPVRGTYAGWRYLVGHEWFRSKQTGDGRVVLSNDEEGKAQADAAALDAAFALRDSSTLILPDCEGPARLPLSGEDPDGLLLPPLPEAT